ncbi:MAG: FGGY-family carbohydrate kinase [Micrococcales bacterium]|nr:FGGY-family carbohydrate kinase [Micrococcales bacterium]
MPTIQDQAKLDNATITSGQTCLGLELGSSRIKAVLIDKDCRILASGGADWENQLVDGLWTYSLEAVWQGIQAAFADLGQDVTRRYGCTLTAVESLGVSAMMHGYLAFDSDGQLLTAFRTWRNTNTGPAAAQLSQAFGVNIPLRWSVAHLYQAIIDHEPNVGSLAFLTTLAGYVHWQLTGEKALGVGDASGMFPVVGQPLGFDQDLVERFGQLPGVAEMPWRLPEVLPRVLVAGQRAGRLSPKGAKLLDPTGQLQPGAVCAPPEGDAGTGMVATGTIGLGSGNVSVGTSIFAMVVTDRLPANPLPEIDIVATPDGLPVAMVHCNNGASELDAWASLFAQFAARLGTQASPKAIFATLLQAALEGPADAGHYLAYNHLAGEPITGTTFGWPVTTRLPGGPVDLTGFARAQVYSIFATLRLGLDLLAEQGIKASSWLAHGGLFNTPLVAQRLMAAALGVPITVGQTASKGGAWGMAVLAAFAVADHHQWSLPDYLADHVFRSAELSTVAPELADSQGFDAFMERYRTGLALERAIDQLERG